LDYNLLGLPILSTKNSSNKQTGKEQLGKVLRITARAQSQNRPKRNYTTDVDWQWFRTEL